MAAVAREVGMDDIGTDEVHAALEAWSRWARTALSGLGWPAVSLLAKVIEYGVRGAAQAGGVRLVEIDQTCELVDRAIQRLDATQKQVVVRTYLGISEAAPVTAQKCGLTYGYYRDVLSKARKRIGDILAGARIKYAQAIV